MCNEDPTLLLFRVSHDGGGGGEVVCLQFFFTLNDTSQTLFLDKEGKLNSSLSSDCNLQTSRLRVGNEGRLKATSDLSHTPPDVRCKSQTRLIFGFNTHGGETEFVVKIS